MRPARLRLAACLLGIGLATCLTVAKADSLVISNAWVRQPPPGTDVLAGYATLENRGEAQIEIEAVSSPSFGAIEIHRTVVDNGIARMQPVTRLVIEPGQQLALAPGSYHLMLFRPQGKLSPGQQIELTLHTTDGRCIPYSTKLRRTPPASAD